MNDRSRRFVPTDRAGRLRAPLLLAAILLGPVASASAAGTPRPEGWNGVPAGRAFRLPVAAAPSDPFPFRLLVVLVEFADIRHDDGAGAAARTPERLYQSLFEDPATAQPPYWSAVSDGRFALSGTITRWVRLDSTYAWYTSDGAGNQGGGIDPDAYPHNAQRLVEEVAARLAGDYDWSEFDNNRDGFVDGLLVLHAGPGLGEAGVPGAGEREVLAAHQFHTRREVPVRNGVVFDYALASADAPTGVVAHELGHQLGLVDLYDTGPFVGAAGPFGLGDWSLMATGAGLGGGATPAGLDAASRVALGFVAPVAVTATDGATPVELADDERGVLRLPAGDDPREYFLVENRPRAGIDQALPGEGLLIYHVDERYPFNRTTASGRFYRVALEQADGRNDLARSGGNRGDASDPYPVAGNDAFADAGAPSSRTNAGEPTGVALEQIARTGAGVRFRLTVDRFPPLVVAGLDLAEIAGNGDGLADPGETFAVDLRLCNRGPVPTGPLSLVLRPTPASEAWVEPAESAGSLASIDPGLCGRSGRTTTFRLRTGVDLPAALTLELLVGSGEASTPVMTQALLLPLRPGGDVELSASPGEPAWQSRSLNPAVPAAWGLDAARVHSAPAARHLGPAAGQSVYPAQADVVYESPLFPVPDAARLTLYSFCRAETLATGRAWDGGRLEIRSGGGDWEALEPAGRYPFRLERGSGNRLEGEGSVSGADAAFRRLVFDLAPRAGEAAQLRFRFASDAFAVNDQDQSGWWLDDLRVEGDVPRTPLSLQAAGDSVGLEWSAPETDPPASWRLARRADLPGATDVTIADVVASAAAGETFRVIDRPPPGRWLYRLRPVEAEGAGLESTAGPVTVEATGAAPRAAIYPNPYRLDGPPLTIDYFLPGNGEPVDLRLDLFDAAGRRAGSFTAPDVPSGEGRIRWAAGESLPGLVPGVYFLQLTGAGRTIAGRRLVVTR